MAKLSSVIFLYSFIYLIIYFLGIVSSIGKRFILFLLLYFDCKSMHFIPYMQIFKEKNADFLLFHPLVSHFDSLFSHELVKKNHR